MFKKKEITLLHFQGVKFIKIKRGSVCRVSNWLETNLVSPPVPGYARVFLDSTGIITKLRGASTQGNRALTTDELKALKADKNAAAALAQKSERLRSKAKPRKVRKSRGKQGRAQYPV